MFRSAFSFQSNCASVLLSAAKYKRSVCMGGFLRCDVRFERKLGLPFWLAWSWKGLAVAEGQQEPEFHTEFFG